MGEETIKNAKKKGGAVGAKNDEDRKLESERERNVNMYCCCTLS